MFKKKNKDKKQKCNACGHEMKTDKEGNFVAGIIINLDKSLPEYKELKDQYKADNFCVCYGCFIKTFGIEKRFCS